jgi:predicted dehydrogenase
VYSEKPLAGTLEQADRLIGAAAGAERLLLCAPAVMASPRFRWLRGVLDAGRVGEPTLARGQIANLGPAAWRPYRGDPAPYYREGVGPVVDEGVYLLHAVTGLMGPARRLQAMGAVAIPERVALSGPRPGASIAVTTSDHVLLQLEFDERRMAQLLSSFAVPATKAPTLELHCTRGTVSLSGHLSAAGPVDVFVADDRQRVQGWIEAVAVTSGPPAVDDLVAIGALHFVGCLRGEEEPVLTAEHARHALEIALAAERAIETGETLELATSFQADGATTVTAS